MSERYFRAIGRLLIWCTSPLWISATVALAQVSVPCPSQAAPPTIVYGQRLLNCAIARPTDQNTFIFQGAPGELVRLTLRQQGGQGAPCLGVLDPSNASVDGQACSSLDLTITLRQSGRYQIVVRERRAEDVFQYELTLDRLLPPSPRSVALQPGDRIADSIRYPGNYNFFHFSGFAARSFGSISTGSEGRAFRAPGSLIQVADRRFFTEWASNSLVQTESSIHIALETLLFHLLQWKLGIAEHI